MARTKTTLTAEEQEILKKHAAEKAAKLQAENDLAEATKLAEAGSLLKERMNTLQQELNIINSQLKKLMPVGDCIQTKQFNVRHQAGATGTKWCVTAKSRDEKIQELISAGYMKKTFKSSGVWYTQIKGESTKTDDDE